MSRLVAVLAVAALVQAPAAAAWTWPLDGPIVRPFVFGSDPYAAGQHRGIDIGGPQGAAVRAATSGSVSFAGTVPSSGKTVTVRTADGLSVTYLELGAVAVARGAEVAEGDSIGVIGSGAHVHLGVRRTVDPQGYLDPLAFLPSRTAAPAGEAEPVPAGVGVEPKEPVTEKPHAAEPPAGAVRATPTEPGAAKESPEERADIGLEPGPVQPETASTGVPAVAESAAARAGRQALPEPARDVVLAGASERVRAVREYGPRSGVAGSTAPAVEPRTVATRMSRVASADARARPASRASWRPSAPSVDSRPTTAPREERPGDTSGDRSAEPRPSHAVGIVAPSPEPAATDWPKVAATACVGFFVVGLLGTGAIVARRRRVRRQAPLSSLLSVGGCPLGRTRPPRLVHACARPDETGLLRTGARPRRRLAPRGPLPRPRRRVLANARG